MYSLGSVFMSCSGVCWFSGGYPQVKPWRIALAVLAVTCLLEFLQRWHPPWLAWLRSVWIGQILLGTTFAWSDFPYYFIGAGLGWLWMQWFHPAKPER